MANYYATTVSESVKVTDAAKVEAVIARYSFGYEGNLSCYVTEDSMLHLYGNDGIYAHRDAVNDEEDAEDSAIEEFLSEIAPYIETPFVIQEVGSEKCRYACAFAYVVMPKGDVLFTSLDDAIAAVLKNYKE